MGRKNLKESRGRLSGSELRFYVGLGVILITVLATGGYVAYASNTLESQEYLKGVTFLPGIAPEVQGPFSIGIASWIKEYGPCSIPIEVSATNLNYGQIGGTQVVRAAEAFIGKIHVDNIIIKHEPIMSVGQHEYTHACVTKIIDVGEIISSTTTDRKTGYLYSKIRGFSFVATQKSIIGADGIKRLFDIEPTGFPPIDEAFAELLASALPGNIQNSLPTYRAVTSLAREYSNTYMRNNPGKSLRDIQNLIEESKLDEFLIGVYKINPNDKNGIMNARREFFARFAFTWDNAKNY